MRGILSKVIFVFSVILIATLQAVDPPQNFRGDIRIEKKIKGDQNRFLVQKP